MDEARSISGWNSFCVESLIDPARKICIEHSHPSDKNKGVARVGHPICVATNKGRINKKTTARTLMGFAPLVFAL
jgi:hypothetical protein